ncbi:hypothetical protein AAHE18_01G092300 [Arachis hypogaea]
MVTDLLRWWWRLCLCRSYDGCAAAGLRGCGGCGELRGLMRGLRGCSGGRDCGGCGRRAAGQRARRMWAKSSNRV